MHAILGTAITTIISITKTFLPRLRHFTQRRLERKENAIAALPTSIDNDYTTISSTFNLENQNKKRKYESTYKSKICRGFGIRLERLPTSVRVLKVLRGFVEIISPERRALISPFVVIW